ncbi:MarR family transcriptional regulator [Streptomyces sp. NPDC059166]|uniref:MarR family transcriptional regulator n=1 Tax=Streptomyces sp. NPDC059166 TaxID=3346752 RepID=UPI0036831300
MGTQHISPAPSAPAASRPYARASPGYGKRSAPDQRPARPGDFALLPERERYVAGYVDRLPEGAAMDIKSLAKSLPLYGQMAVGSALRALGVAGHLRHVRSPADAGGGQIRWITRTYWSRTARDNEWWTAFVDSAGVAAGAHTPPAAPDPAPAHDAPAVSMPPHAVPVAPASECEAPAPAAALPGQAQACGPVVPQQRAQGPGDPQVRPGGPVGVTDPAEAAEPAPAPAPVAALPSPAYLALARLGRTDARVSLSAADCAALEGLAAAWLARGVSEDHMIRTLSAGLPPTVDSPVGFVRRRLRDKIPPEVPCGTRSGAVPGATDAPGARTPRPMVECAECGVPGRPEALPDGLCRSCRVPAQEPAVPGPAAETAGEPVPTAAPSASAEVAAYVGTLRELLRLP